MPSFRASYVLGVGSILTDVFNFFEKVCQPEVLKSMSYNKENCKKNTILIGCMSIAITKMCNNTRFEVPKDS